MGVNKKAVVIIILFFIVVLGIFYMLRNDALGGAKKSVSAAPASLTTPLESQSNKTDLGSFTLADVGTHNSRGDCWMAIDGRVYNLTSYVKIHPGGSIITNGCGRNATEMFNKRPGKMTPHSAVAKQILRTFEIGTLAN